MKNKIILSGLATVLLSLYSCNKADDVIMPNPPGAPNIQYTGFSFVNSETNSDAPDITLRDDQNSLKLHVTTPVQKEDLTPEILQYNYAGTDGEVNKILEEYFSFKKLPKIEVLPKEFYNITATDIKSGNNKTDISLEIINRENIPYGNFIIPVVVSIGDKKVTKFVSLTKDGEYVAISEENPKPLPPNSDLTRPMKTIAFVETNDWDIRNYGQVILKETKQPVFDIIVLFAANMNYDAVAGRRYIHFNDKLQPIVNHPEIYIKPLKDRGIKVLIDILPNHQGVGYRNFQSYEEALDFAREAKMWTDKLGIDGWDMDEEYANYSQLPSKPYNTMSAEWFCKAMKEVMPDKLLTLYEYGYPSGDYSQYVDYSWTDYGISGASYYGIPTEKHARRSVEAARNGLVQVGDRARKNLQEKTLGLMIFNANPHIFEMSGSNSISRLSDLTQVFYGQDCIFSGKYFLGPRD